MQSRTFQAVAHSLGADFLGAVLNAIPDPVLIVDDDVRILHLNAAAAELFAGSASVLMTRSGEAMHCIHSTDSPGGCGAGAACRNCDIRNSVRAAHVGKHVCRKAQRMQVLKQGRATEIDLLVTTAPFQYDGKTMVLMVLEDITELESLRKIVPVCAGCRKIRDDKQYWQQVDLYLIRHMNVDVTHGICPDCLARLYPGLEDDGTEPG